jgi:hypothetical protein
MNGGYAAGVGFYFAYFGRGVQLAQSLHAIG